MYGLLNFRERILNIFEKRGEVLLTIFKFIIGVLIFYSMSYLSFGCAGNKAVMAVSLFFGLLCIVISPFGFYLLTVGAAAIYIYTASVELCIIVVFVMLALGIFYIRLFPKEALIIPALIIGFHFNVPYAVIIFAAFYAGLSGIAPVVIGSVLWGLITNCLGAMAEIAPKEGYQLLSAPEKIMDMFKILSDNMTAGSGFLVQAFLYGVIMAVFIILNKVLIINYIKEISIVAMGVILMAVTLIVNGFSKMGMNPGLIIAGGIVSIIIMIIIRFFDNVLDYKTAERVQFEDDDYYYYVKAIPKVKASDFNENRKKSHEYKM